MIALVGKTGPGPAVMAVACPVHSPPADGAQMAGAGQGMTAGTPFHSP
jgi:hypothetical protein